MILVDTPIWIDHLHETDAGLSALLDDGRACAHPMIIGELATGSIRGRSEFLGLVGDLPGVEVAGHDEVMAFVEGRALYGRGLSLVDAHLLASVVITPETALWTRDRRLRAVAEELGIAASIHDAERPRPSK